MEKGEKTMPTRGNLNSLWESNGHEAVLGKMTRGTKKNRLSRAQGKAASDHFHISIGEEKKRTLPNSGKAGRKEDRGVVTKTNVPKPRDGSKGDGSSLQRLKEGGIP